jgi:hypothetical protein
MCLKVLVHSPRETILLKIVLSLSGEGGFHANTCPPGQGNFTVASTLGLSHLSELSHAQEARAGVRLCS